MQQTDHAVLARWAANCAERALHLFTGHSDDTRPQRAVETCRTWAEGEIRAGACMKAAVAAHAAARETTHKAAVAAARAAGHAAATAHAADHSIGALLYALKALEASGVASDTELDLQLARLPEHLRRPVSSGTACRMTRLGIRGTAVQ